MRRRSILPGAAAVLLAVLAACATAPPPHRYPAAGRWGPEIEVTVFYDSLAPYGTWVSLESYPRVWIPRGMPPAWRPYTMGHWTYTDLGWTWVSDRPWGWGPFHYGRWLWTREHGWAWIPGTVWAPAWVAWREGDGWIGWAPLPPRVGWQVGVGLDLGGVSLGLAIGNDGWCFVEERHFLELDLRSAIVAVPRNRALVQRTRDVTRYSERERRVVTGGVDVRKVERAVGRPVVPRRIEDASAPPPRRRGDGRGSGAVEVYRPRVKESPDEPRGARRTRPPRAKPPG